MKINTHSRYMRPSIKSTLVSIVVCSLFVLSSTMIYGQGGSAPTPLGLAPGTPAGSYALSNIDSVNLFNGHVNVTLQLSGASGGGDAGGPVTLAFNSPDNWSVITYYDENNNPYYYVEPPDVNGELFLGEFRVTVNPEGGGAINQCVDQRSIYQLTLTRLTVTEPDGTEHQMRDVLTGGQVLGNQGCYPDGPSRGTVFVSADDSGITYIADAPLFDGIYVGNEWPTGGGAGGWLLLKDGRRYRVGTANGQSEMRDRNGNQMSWTFGLTDSLNRQITPVWLTPNPTQCTALGFGETSSCQYVSYKGFNGTEAGIERKIWIAYEGAMRPLGVLLPNGRSYRFYYNNYHDLTRIDLPTGGSIEYEYEPGMGGTQPDYSQVVEGAIPGTYLGDRQGQKYGAIYRRTTERRVYREGHVLESRQTIGKPEYLYNVQGSGASTSYSVGNLGYVERKQYDANNNLLSSEKHYFYGSSFSSLFSPSMSYAGWKNGREYRTEIFDASGNLIRRVDQTWQQRAPVDWYSGPEDYYPSNDPRLAETITTLENGVMSKSTYAYDPSVPYNRLTDQYDYNYGNGQPGPLLRRAHTDYLTTNPVNNLDYTGTDIYLRQLPSQQWVSSDAAGNNKLSRTVYEYDNYASDSLHAPLVNRSGISGHDSAFTTSYTTRGNVTKVTSYSDAQNSTGAVSVASQYDIAGNVVKMIDARGYATTIDYSDRFGYPDDEAQANYPPTQLGGQSSYAFPTSVTKFGFTSYSQFDYHTGHTVNSKDINGTVGAAFYSDTLDRQTQVITAINRLTLKSQTTITYDDANRKVTVTGDLRTFNDNLLKGESFFDGLGRTTESRKYEGDATFIATRQTYDALGRVYQSSNPYRPTLGEQPVWTTTAYDVLSRVTSVTTPDGASVTKAYVANITTVTDQAGKKRLGISDAFGRMIKVIEDPYGALYAETTYLFDAIGNLRMTTQGGQKRYFLYDSLGRQIRSKNPEQTANSSLALSDPITGNSQWASSFTYDADGNVLTKTDARGVTVTNTYDPLSRPVTRSYSDGTPTVTFGYDAVLNSKGKLTSVSSSISTETYTGYDELGRVTGNSQTTGGQTYVMGYGYDLAGNLTSETYPSGRIVTNTIDDTGRLSSISGQQPSQPVRNYASNFAYTSFEAVKQMRLGNGRWESAQFNSRLQTTVIGLGASIGDTSYMKLAYDYGTVDNNSCAHKQTITVRDMALPMVQTYNFEGLNRLKGVEEKVNNQRQWRQTFLYDRFGNRTMDTSLENNDPNLSMTTPSLVGPNPQISSATNRIIQGTNEQYEYDFAGNLTKDKIGNTFTYDGDNMQIKYNGGTSQGGTDYQYDGQGNRVKKVSSASTTVFVYDAMGKMVSEYDTSFQQTTARTSYLTTDDLGSPRVVTDGGGAVTSRHDYLAFGEEIGWLSGRSDVQKYVGDNTRQQYTGYERDDESGLDYAQARYYSSAHGRFTSVDPLMASATIRNPQTFNRYSYALNNPYKFTDPLGLRATSPGGNGAAEPGGIDPNDPGEQQGKQEHRQDIKLDYEVGKERTYRGERVKTPDGEEFKGPDGKPLGPVWGTLSVNTLRVTVDGKPADPASGVTVEERSISVSATEVRGGKKVEKSTEDVSSEGQPLPLAKGGVRYDLQGSATRTEKEFNAMRKSQYENTDVTRFSVSDSAGTERAALTVKTVETSDSVKVEVRKLPIP